MPLPKSGVHAIPKTQHPNEHAIESLLAETRLLHWANFYTYTTGYLHCGCSPSWGSNMFRNSRRIHPIRDGYLIYPGLAEYRDDVGAKHQERSLDRIRYETMRDGAENYELLRILAKRDRKKADDICSMVMYNLTAYATDSRDVNNARRVLLEALQQSGRLAFPYFGVRIR
jgi:hypothetical protein